MKAIDVGAILDEGRWSGHLKFLVALTALTIVFDGADVQLLGVAIPSLMKEWDLPRSAFAPMLATGMLGMMIGGAIAGMLGDRWGRKLVLICSVAVFALMTLAIAFVNGLVGLGVLRFLAGLGLGGAMPNAASLAAEYVPRRHRPVAVTLTIVCVPLGGMVGAFLASRILPTHGWRTLFVIGGLTPLAIAVALKWRLAESPRFLARHPDRWPELAGILRRAGHDVPHGIVFVDTSERPVARSRTGVLFGSNYRRDTLGLWGAFFTCLLAVYTGFNWIPSMLTGAGFTLEVGSRGVLLFNLGGVAGAIASGFLIARFGSRTTMLSLSAGAIASTLVLAFMPIEATSDPLPVIVMLTLTGALINAVQTTMYALAAHVYPAAVRATGVGTAVSFGRIGGVLSTYVGSWALELGGTLWFFGAIAASMGVTFVSLSLVSRHVLGSARAADAAQVTANAEPAAVE